jgi:large subunit ribosomal protein L10
MRKEEKSEKIEQYDQAVSDATFAILVEYSKLKVAKVDAFRATLFDLGCGVIVMKNTLARIVFERHGMQQACEYLAGPSLLIYGASEISPVAKALARFIRENPVMQVKAIIFDGQTYPKAQFQSFITMPTKDEIRAKLLSVLKAPATQFVHIINAPQRLANVLQAYVDQAG